MVLGNCQSEYLTVPLDVTFLHAAAALVLCTLPALAALAIRPTDQNPMDMMASAAITMPRRLEPKNIDSSKCVFALRRNNSPDSRDKRAYSILSLPPPSSGLGPGGARN